MVWFREEFTPLRGNVLLVAAVFGLIQHYRVNLSPPVTMSTVLPQWRQHFLYFLPLPHGQGSLRPTLTFDALPTGADPEGVGLDCQYAQSK
jgi:hypothetical protein